MRGSRDARPGDAAGGDSDAAGDPAGDACEDAAGDADHAGDTGARSGLDDDAKLSAMRAVWRTMRDEAPADDAGDAGEVGAADDAGGPGAGPGGLDDDAKLSAMRAVWLTMRDEEPSSGGLAELLAAARTKAAELQPRPSWWQRVAAGLRRPSVFALATALVVLGGALVVGRNAKRAEPALEVSSSGSAAQGAGAPTASLREGGAYERGAGKDEPQPARVDLATEAKPERADVDARVPPAEHAPGPMTTTPPARREAPRGRPATGAVTGESSRGRPAQDAADEASRARPAQEAVDAASSAGLAKDASARGDSAGATSALYEACEAAAARGDCASARRIAARISMTDRGYRARLTRGSAIAKCLDAAR